LFDYNVPQRVNEFVATAISQVFIFTLIRTIKTLSVRI
jgi:hypothetical protein